MRPQILFLAHRTPYPPNRGDRIRSFHLIKFLAERADLHLAFLSEETVPDATRQALQSHCVQVAWAPWRRRGRWVSAAASMAAGKTATVGLFRSRELRRKVRCWAQATRFDAAVAFCSSMAQYLEIPELENTPALVDLCDVDSQKWFDYAAHAAGPKRWLFQTEGRRLRRLEASLARRSEAVTLVSKSEADLYRSFCPSDRIYAIPNGVDLDYFDPDRCDRATSQAPKSHSCVFVGALDYRANIDGIRWFCEEVWPEVLRRNPGATFEVVGSNPSAEVRRLCDAPGVTLVGPVPDVRPYLARSALVVVPLRVARGLQNKVIEALAMAKAVVATPQAAEGLAVHDGVHLQLAAKPQEWVSAMEALWKDSSIANRLGREGRCFAIEHHRWDAQLAPLAELLGLAHEPRAIPLKTSSPTETQRMGTLA